MKLDLARRDIALDLAQPAAAGPVRVYVHNTVGRGAREHFARFLAGTAADRSPYGFHRAREFGVDVVLSEDSPRRWLRLASRVSVRLLGFDVPHAAANLRRVRAAEVVWSMTEKEAFAVALLQALRLTPRRPIITSTVWITDQWHRLSAPSRWLYRRLGRHFDVVTAQSQTALDLARSIFSGSRVELMYFGINTDTFTPTPPEARPAPDVLTIFAAGTDRTRDWETLLKAFGNDRRYRLEIYCCWLPMRLTQAYRNVRVHRAMDMDRFVGAIRDADIVAVPMVDNTFSGITFAINSAAMGKPILATRTGGVTTYFDEDDVLYCDVGDVAGMRQVVVDSTPEGRLALASRAHRRFRQRDYTTEGMIARFVALTDAVRGARGSVGDRLGAAPSYHQQSGRAANPAARSSA